MLLRFRILVAGLWWGSLTGLGVVVVPMLFAHLQSSAVAGAMAARLFTAQTWFSVACAMLLLLSFGKKEAAASSPWVQPAIKFIVLGLLLAVLMEFGVAPRIVNARAEGADLKLWHGLGSAMYIAQWLCAGVSLWLLAKPCALTGSNAK